MKKITLSVAALAIAISSYGQCDIPSDPNYVDYNVSLKQFKAVEYQLLDLIDAIRMDMYYGHFDQAKGMYYINEMVKLQSRNRDLMADTYKAFSMGDGMTRIDNNLR